MRVYILYQVNLLVIVAPFIDPAGSKGQYIRTTSSIQSNGSILVQACTRVLSHYAHLIGNVLT